MKKYENVRAGDELNRHDAVSAEREEGVVDSDAIEAEHLGEQTGERLLETQAHGLAEVVVHEPVEHRVAIAIDGVEVGRVGIEESRNGLLL